MWQEACSWPTSVVSRRSAKANEHGDSEYLGLVSGACQIISSTAKDWDARPFQEGGGRLRWEVIEASNATPSTIRSVQEKESADRLLASRNLSPKKR